MLLKPNTAPFALVLSAFLLTTANAVPMRTHCHCSIIPSSRLLTPQETDLLSTTTARSADPCINLGTDLEFFRNEDPDLYHSYINPGNPEVTPTSDSYTPLTTTVLMELAAEYGIVDLSVELTAKSKPGDEMGERLICHSDPSLTMYKSSALGLWALQFIVVLTVLACILECVALVRAWYSPREQDQQVQLYGEEKSLKAYSAANAYPSHATYSDEKQVVVSSNRLNSDEDDEIVRPVL